jgi:hypothetical protein
MKFENICVRSLRQSASDPEMAKVQNSVKLLASKLSPLQTETIAELDGSPMQAGL